MTDLFIAVLNMSITASYVALVVMVVRLIFRKVPKILSYALWIVVLFRLIFPFSIESVFSLIPASINIIPQDIISVQNPIINSGIGIVDNTINQSMDTYLPPVNPVESINPMGIIISVASYIWILGMVVLLCYSVVSYLKLRHQLSTAIQIQDNIYQTDQTEIPFVLGLIHPKIYIPIGICKSELDYILKHEQIHIKRRDHIVKSIAFVAVSIHWFNPIIWISFSLMTKDMEMSCDESVMKQSKRDIRGDYSKTLLSMSAKQSNLNFPLTFGKNNTKTRIKNVLDYKKSKFWVVVVSVMIVLIVGIGMILNPQHISQSIEKANMAKVWAEALKTRDGKPRYEMMSEGMKQQFIKEQTRRVNGDDWNFVIGGSSPKVTAYNIEIKKDIGAIIYSLSDSGGGEYSQTELITFGKENNKLVIIGSKNLLAQWEEYSYFAPTAQMAMEVYAKALLDSDYLTLHSLSHLDEFNIAGQDIWDTIKISEIKIMDGYVGEDKAYYELELDIKDGGESAFETGVSTRWLWIIKEDEGWYVEGLMISGKPEEDWWKTSTSNKETW